MLLELTLGSTHACSKYSLIRKMSNDLQWQRLCCLRHSSAVAGQPGDQQQVLLQPLHFCSQHQASQNFSAGLPDLHRHSMLQRSCTQCCIGLYPDVPMLAWEIWAPFHECSARTWNVLDGIGQLEVSACDQYMITSHDLLSQERLTLAPKSGALGVGLYRPSNLIHNIGRYLQYTRCKQLQLMTMCRHEVASHLLGEDLAQTISG